MAPKDTEGSPGPKCKSFPVDPSACREKKQVFGPVKMEEMPDVDHVSWIRPLYEDGSIQKFTIYQTSYVWLLKP